MRALLDNGAELRAAAESFLKEKLGASASVCTMAQLAGGASQEAWSLEVAFERAGVAERLPLVMRRDMGGAFTNLALPRAREFEVLRAAHAAGVAVPTPYWYAPDIAGRPAFFMARVEGEAVGRRVVTDEHFAAARAVLPKQMAQALAAIHTLDYRKAGLERFLQQPVGERSAASVELDRITSELDALAEPHPALELGLRWLRCNAPPRDGAAAFVHGDFRIGNVLVESDGLRAVLDWEFAHLGDPAEDIGWACVRAWRFGNDALRFGGICDRAEFLREYERAGGGAIEPERAFYWEVLGNVKWAVGSLGQARRHLDGHERSVELASLGRICAEMEFEVLELIERLG